MSLTREQLEALKAAEQRMQQQQGPMVMAVAEPVVVGIREFKAERARRVSLAGLSTISCVFVTLCRVVIEPCAIPISS